MTGHGRGQAESGGYQILVELSTVNRKQFELSCSLPRGFSELEPKIRELTSTVVQRGRLNCSVSFECRATTKVGQTLDEAAAKRYCQELEGLKKKLKLKDSITLEQILHGPGVQKEVSVSEGLSLLLPGLEEALTKALKQLVKMREQEGSHLAKEFQRLMTGIEQSTQRIALLAPVAVERHRQALHRRLSEAGFPLPIEDERLAREVVLFADRSDITEELTRLSSHGQQFRQLLKKTEPIGRTLEFLVQEFQREVNTIGSKANDLEITQQVMFLKGELEKVREQIQNVE